MNSTRLMCYFSLLLIPLAASPQGPATQPPKEHPNRTRVVLLGTGTPVPDPESSGPATAIVVDDSAYLVDFGPGVVRRAKAAVFDRYITALEPANLKVAFVTHLHSDHTAGYSDLILTGWTAGRRTALEVYGPRFNPLYASTRCRKNRANRAVEKLSNRVRVPFDSD